jgi:hypothetical protein
MGETAQELYNVWSQALGVESYWDDLSPEEHDAWRAVAMHVDGGTTPPVDKRTTVEGMTERHDRLDNRDVAEYAREA